VVGGKKLKPITKYDAHDRYWDGSQLFSKLKYLI
jgi:hypothetical protein